MRKYVAWEKESRFKLCIIIRKQYANRFNYFCGSMLDAIDAHFGKYFPCAFGSQPIHLTVSISISSAGNRTEKTILFSNEMAFLTRSDKILMFAFRNFGLKNSEMRKDRQSV